jgi:hypothetical protein
MRDMAVSFDCHRTAENLRGVTLVVDLTSAFN